MQPLKVFQPLLSPLLKMNIRTGQFYAQAAFSAARKEGFSAGGHWVVKNGGLWLQDGEVSGVNFVLPYRLKDQRWQLGVRQPVTLRIDVLDNLFRMSNIASIYRVLSVQRPTPFGYVSGRSGRIGWAYWAVYATLAAA